MQTIETTSRPVPANIKNQTRADFLAQENTGTLTGDDLYWLLYRAAVDAGDSADNFYSEVDQLLAARLGAGNYVYGLCTQPGANSGMYGNGGSLLPNCVFWGGAQGVLPGFGSKNAIECFVFMR